MNRWQYSALVRGGFFIFLLGIDQISKFWVSHAVPLLLSYHGGYPFGGIPIFCMKGLTLSLNQTFNTGIAWGLWEGHAAFWFGLRLVAIAALFAYFVCVFWSRVREAFCIGLILAGAIGNVLDYLLYGHVIDFLHVAFGRYSFPIFNVADSCITLGAIGLLIASGRQKEKIIS